jgi:hypothetical protein
MLILSLHILVATIMTCATVGVFAAARTRRETKAYSAMLLSFGATIVSGAGLLFISTAGFGRFCVMMSTFSISVLVARAYYKKRSLPTAAEI